MFYVYEHWRPDTNQCFYVGKGKGRRAWEMTRRNIHHKRIVEKLNKLGLVVEVKIIISDISEETAFLVEKDLIAKHGKDNLANMTDGGEGISGFKNPASEETKKKISDAKKGKPSNRKGAKLSNETREKIRIANIGRKLTDEIKTKLSAAKKGKLPNSYGKPITAETREKLSRSVKAAWDKRKQDLQQCQ